MGPCARHPLTLILLAWILANSGLGVAMAATPATREALIAAEYPRGRLAFQQRCSACHTLAEGGANLAGPNLWGLIGAGAGTLGEFPTSAALRGAGFNWDPDRLWRFLADPPGYIPGNSMAIPEPVPETDRVPMIAFIMLETGGADWPKPVLAGEAPEDRDRPLAERFPSFWNHLMTNTTRYRMETGEGTLRFDVYFRPDGSLGASEPGIRGFWHVDERDFFCYALYGLQATPTQLVECFPVVAMSIPRFAEELWTSRPVAGVVLHGGIVAGRP